MELEKARNAKLQLEKLRMMVFDPDIRLSPRSYADKIQIPVEDYHYLYYKNKKKNTDEHDEEIIARAMNRA